MNPFLLFKDKSLTLQKDFSSRDEALLDDLGIEPILQAMSEGDELIYQSSKTVLLNILTDAESIHYRQEILRDCLKNQDTVRRFYEISTQTVEREKNIYFGFFSRNADSMLSRSIEVFEMFIDEFYAVKKIITENINNFNSPGFRNLFDIFTDELNDTYLSKLLSHLKNLRFKRGMLISAGLGKGNKGVDYTIRKELENENRIIKRIMNLKNGYSVITVNENDLSGMRALSDIKAKSIAKTATLLASSADHVLNFFKTFQIEIGFYIGALSLYNRLKNLNLPISFPEIVLNDDFVIKSNNLYDIALSLSLNGRVIKNRIENINRNPVIITGANKGGKTTLLRSIGQSQLLMQSGMFVPADFYTSNISNGIFTHFIREEDSELKSGKLDEELNRMNDIANNLSKYSLLLFNESFETTNEIEGSEIGRQIVEALVENKVRVVFVTHLYTLARHFLKKYNGKALFLRAERGNNGERTFKIKPGNPLSTSFGVDLYHTIFK